MRNQSADRYHYGYDLLSKYLLRCGPDFYDFAAAFAEQGILEVGGTIEHSHHCDLCVPQFGPDIRGPRFVCLDCLDGDFCATCYAIWEQSRGQMDYCKGHRFYEIPRACYYQFKEGVVMQDGSTLPVLIESVQAKYNSLLAATVSESTVEKTFSSKRTDSEHVVQSTDRSRADTTHTTYSCSTLRETGVGTHANRSQISV